MITATQVGRLSVALNNGRHKIISDVAVEIGGEDSGPNPHELLEAALAACTSQTLELYARRKSWDLTNLSIEVKVIKEENKETLIERNITFGEQNSEEERSRLIQIANKCPIHKILESSIKIETYEK